MLPPQSEIGDDGAQCSCECPIVPPPYTTVFSEPTACQPFYVPPQSQCNASVPLVGFSYRTVACQSHVDNQYADLTQCHEQDCALTPFDKAALNGLTGNGAMLTDTCHVWQNCDIRKEYKSGEWGECSGTCWDKRGSPTVQPSKTREVCMTVMF
jgi:hypothetical protein